MNKLKPCPFCGGKAEMLMTTEVGTPSGDKGTKVVVSCGNRECSCKVVKWALKIGWAQESAIKAWNRRADQGQADKVAELEQSVRQLAQVLYYHDGINKSDVSSIAGKD